MRFIHPRNRYWLYALLALSLLLSATSGADNQRQTHDGDYKRSLWLEDPSMGPCDQIMTTPTQPSLLHVKSPSPVLLNVTACVYMNCSSGTSG